MARPFVEAMEKHLGQRKTGKINLQVLLSKRPGGQFLLLAAEGPRTAVGGVESGATKEVIEILGQLRGLERFERGLGIWRVVTNENAIPETPALFTARRAIAIARITRAEKELV